MRRKLPLTMRTPTCGRIVWVAFSRLLTLIIPDSLLKHVGGMATPAARLAWREKIALCTLYLAFAAFFCFWLEYISTLFCDADKPYPYRSIFSNQSDYAAINGRVVDWSKYTESSTMAANVNEYPGHDLSPWFPLFMQLKRGDGEANYQDNDIQACIAGQGMSETADRWLSYKLENDPGYRYENEKLLSCPLPDQLNATGAPCYYQPSQVEEEKSMGSKGDIEYDLDFVSNCSYLSITGSQTPSCGFVVLDSIVLDVASYLETATNIIKVSDNISSRAFALDRMYLPLDLTVLLFINLGEDISPYFNGNVSNAAVYRSCLPKLFGHGVIESDAPSGCTRINPALWATMGCGLVYFLIKMNLANLSRLGFVQRWLFKSSSLDYHNSRGTPPASSWPYTILMVPAYAESSETIRQTLDSLARTSYEDTKKLLLFVCDGVTKSAYDAKETHQCILDALGHSSMEDLPSHAYASLGQNKRRINYAKVYAGFCEVGRNRVPFVVIVKVGSPGERLVGRAPGNRGKRDSMVMILSFLERCLNLQHNCMTPFEYELFHQCYSVLGIDPRKFKYMLVADADTQVQSNVVQKLVRRLENDCKMLAISGHVRPANPEQNFTTMLQIFPLYMTFFSGLAYEACLGNVISMNGGLAMYKLWTEHISSDLTPRPRPSRLARWLPFGLGDRWEIPEKAIHPKWPKVSDEISRSVSSSSTADVPFATGGATWRSRGKDEAASTMSSQSSGEASRLSLAVNPDIKSCCIHPTVLRGFATPAADTMHMKNVLLLGEEQYLGIVLLRSHPGYRLGFEPEAIGYVTLPTNFFALQGMMTRNLRAAFHNEIELQQVAHHIGFSYWILSTTKIMDMIFSMPIIVYLYGVYGHFLADTSSLAYAIIAGSFGVLFILHVIYFVVRRQFKYVFWFLLYCLVSVPIFAVYFPLAAAWTSDYCERWYDVWPTESAPSTLRRGRIHGLVDDSDPGNIEHLSDGRRGHTTPSSYNSKEAEEDHERGQKDLYEEEEVSVQQDVVRLRLDEYERLEAQKAHRRAMDEAAALDANFLGFTGVSNRTASLISRRSVASMTRSTENLPRIPSLPPVAQVKDVGRHGHGRHHEDYEDEELMPHLFSTQTASSSQVDNMANPFADPYENPFDDTAAIHVSSSSGSYNLDETASLQHRHRQNYRTHKPSQSQSSYFSRSSDMYYPGPMPSTDTLKPESVIASSRRLAASTPSTPILARHYRCHTPSPSPPPPPSSTYSHRRDDAPDPAASASSLRRLSIQSSQSGHSLASSCLSFDPDSFESHAQASSPARTTMRDHPLSEEGRSMAVHSKVGLKIPERANLGRKSPMPSIRQRSLHRHSSSLNHLRGKEDV